MIDPIDVPVDIAAVVPEGNPSDIPASNSELVVKPISANLKFIRSATFAQILSLNSEDIEEMEQSFKNDDKNNLLQPSDKRLINSRLNYKKKSIKMQSAKSDLMAIQKKKIALLIMNFCIMVIFNLCYSIGLSFVFVNETIMLSYKFVQGAIRQIRTSEFQLPQWYFLLIYIALFAGQSYCNWKSLQISIEGQKRLTKLQIYELQLRILDQNIADIFDI